MYVCTPAVRRARRVAVIPSGRYDASGYVHTYVLRSRFYFDPYASRVLKALFSFGSFFSRFQIDFFFKCDPML
jgi:hypothetical protein